MIFVTVGTQLPFDRLIGAADAWAGTGGGRQMFAQIGPSRLRPGHMEHAEFISPQECSERMRAASAIVAHAGVGTILTALELGKPLIVMPRRASLGEHRNDHQLATAHRFAELGRVKVAFDEDELSEKLDELDELVAQPTISSSAPADFILRVRAFILGRALLPLPEAQPRFVTSGLASDDQFAGVASGQRFSRLPSGDEPDLVPDLLAVPVASPSAPS